MGSAKPFSKSIQLALEHERQILWTVVLFPLLAVILIATFKAAPRVYWVIIREDSLVEWATAIIYFIAASFAVSLALYFWRQKEKIYGLLYGILAVGMFLVGMDEISWGQRLFGINTPQILEYINAKDESNFHNLSSFPLHEAFIVVGFYGAFSRLILTPPLGKRYPKFVDLLTPPYALCLYFFIPLALYAYFEFILRYTELGPSLQWHEYLANKHFITGKDQEPIELLLSFGFLLFAALNWARYRVGAPFTFLNGQRSR